MEFAEYWTNDVESSWFQLVSHLSKATLQVRWWRRRRRLRGILWGWGRLWCPGPICPSSSSCCTCGLWDISICVRCGQGTLPLTPTPCRLQQPGSSQLSPKVCTLAVYHANTLDEFSNIRTGLGCWVPNQTELAQSRPHSSPWAAAQHDLRGTLEMKPACAVGTLGPQKQDS